MDDRDKVVGQLYAGKYIVYEDLSVKEFLTYWLEEEKRKTMTAASYDGYKNVVYNHLIPYFEGVNVSSIKMSHIRELYNVKMAFSQSVTKLIKTVTEYIICNRRTVETTVVSNVNFTADTNIGLAKSLLGIFPYGKTKQTFWPTQ